MKIDIRTIAFSLATVATLIGCGGSNVANERSSLSEPIVPLATKVTRADWTGVEPVANGFFITNDNSLLSFKIKDQHIADNSYHSEIILIDADHNAQTGYHNQRWGDIGAEYLIEGNSLYSYTGTREEWSWNFVARVSRRVIDGQNDELEVEFPRSLIQTPDNQISAEAALTDENWATLTATDIVNYELTGDGVVENSFQLTDSEQQIDFTMQSAFITSADFRATAIFIDADNNPQTGYRNERWDNIGAEYLIIDGAVYSYGGEGWSWNFLSNVQRDIQDTNAHIVVNKEGLTLGNTIRTVAGILDQNWQVMFRYDLSSATITGNQPEPLPQATIQDSMSQMQIVLQSEEIANGNAALETIFIDTDNNPQTGYSNARLDYGAMGADYMIQGDIVYHYNGEGWSWSRIGNATVTRENDTMHIVFDKLPLHFGANIRLFPTLTDANWQTVTRYAEVDVTPMQPAEGVTVRHDLNFFWFGMQNDNLTLNDTMQTEIYIDEDDNPNTGFEINGIGAEYRIVNDRAFALRGNGEWGDLLNGEDSAVVYQRGEHGVNVRTRRSQLRYTHRHIAVTGRVVDENNNEVFAFTPTHYVVQADNDEITLNLDNPDYYTFEFHSPLIQEAHFGHDAVDDLVTSLHLAIDLDNNRFTGNQMNAVGADYFTGSWSSHRELYHFIGTEGTHSWWERWETVDDSDTIVTVQDGLVTIAIPRSALPVSGPFTVASTFNDSHGHFYWTNHYEFDLGN